MTPSLIPYLAGVFDGEGCITQARVNGYLYLKVCVGMQCRDIVYLFSDTFGGAVTDRSNGIYNWQAYKTAGGKALKEMEPYLIEKKEQAKLALRILQLPRKSKSKKEMFSQLKALKRLK